jgi:hypothetical protein
MPRINFTIRAFVSGTFENKLEGIQMEKHPIGFRFRVGLKLRELAKLVRLKVEGVADSGAFIDECHDFSSDTVNETATPGGVIALTGAKLKVMGKPQETGVYLIAPCSPIVTTKVMAGLIENRPSKIIAVLPQLPTGKQWYVEVRTQYTGSSILLKEVRSIRSDFMLST